MLDVTMVLLGISLILFFGFFAEFVFKKIQIPDILFLIALGFALGPFGFKYVDPEYVKNLAPVFTTFTLMFLLYDGGVNMDLSSFAKGVAQGLGVSLFNFFISAIVITGIAHAFGFKLLIAVMIGCILGGVSSAFVLPLLKQLKVSGKANSVLALESALTDVYCIVFALTVMEIIQLNTFDVQVLFGKIASLFAIAGFIGVVAGIVWIILTAKVFVNHKSYMITIAYLILIYILTEFLNGNGAIAALFFGLVLGNSKKLTSIFEGIVTRKKRRKGQDEFIVEATTSAEEFFYGQISFLLKTFFFVYIGLLLNINDTQALIIAAVIAVALMFSRNASGWITKQFPSYDRKIIKSIFARGLASAAIAQILLLNGMEDAILITNIVYAVIIFTIVLSSIRVFWANRSE